MLDEYIRPFPRVVRIEPSGACNLSCSHCPTGTVNMTRGIMRTDTFSLILRGIQPNVEAIKVVVLYHGGEPLLQKHFGDMVREIKALGVPFIKTVSNGMLLTKATMAGIVANGLDAIEFSLDGQSPEENNLVRRDCDYNTVVQNIKHLIDYKREQKSATPKIFISSTQFLIGDNQSLERQEPVVPDHLVEEFAGEYSREIAGFKCAWAMRWPHMQVLEEIYDIYSDPNDQEITNSCDHVDNTITIRWNGDIVACCYDLTSMYVLGNVHKDDLTNIWNNKRYVGLRRSIDKMKLVPMCANCNVVMPSVYLTLKPAVRAKLRPKTVGEQNDA